MRKPVLSSFGVLIGALAFTLAILALLRLMTQQAKHAVNHPAAPTSVGTSAYPMTFRDGMGRTVTLPAAPQRIISLAPSMTELLFALGAGDRLIADTRFCIHPPEAIQKIKIGGIMDPDMEKILTLHPDLVIGTALTPREVAEQIDRLGIHSVYFKHTTIESVYSDTVELATILGIKERGEKLVADLRSRETDITKRLAALPPGQARPKVLLLLRIDGLFSAGKGTFPSELIERARGENVAAQATTSWPQLSMETIIAANPDVIVVAIGEGKVEYNFLQTTWKKMQTDPHWKNISAVKNNRLVQVKDDLITIPGPRLMEALEAIAVGLHPEIATPKK